jgi:hypothetical protein
MTSPTSRCRFAFGISLLIDDNLGVGSRLQSAYTGQGRGFAPTEFPYDGVYDFVDFVGSRGGR